MEIMLPSTNFSSTQAVSILNSQEIKRSIFVTSNHPEVLQCLHNCLFLLRWTLWLLGIFRFRLIVILTLDDTAFLLHLSNIQAADLQTGIFQHIILNLLIGSFLLRIGQIHLVHLHFDFNMLSRFQFGQ